YSVALDSPSHGWTGGHKYVSGNFVPGLLEYTGASPQSWVDRTDRLPANSPVIVDMALTAGTGEGWAVGGPSGGAGKAILHVSDGVWTLAQITGTGFLGSVALGGPGEAWATGCGLYHYTSGAWRSEPFPTNQCFY